MQYWKKKILAYLPTITPVRRHDTEAKANALPHGDPRAEAHSRAGRAHPIWQIPGIRQQVLCQARGEGILDEEGSHAQFRGNDGLF